MSKTVPIFVGILAFSAAAPALAATNLIVNGDFETTPGYLTTPVGWTALGAQTGTLAYTDTSTPAYDGKYYYDIGGSGTNGNSAYGQGISQTVATDIGATYTLTFGYSDENGPGLTSQLLVGIGSTSQTITLVSTATDLTGFFQRPFTTTSYDFTATDTSTTISFALGSSYLTASQATSYGNNDPLLDKISFVQTRAATPSVPEPASWAMFIGGFGMIGGAMRRKTALVRFARA